MKKYIILIAIASLALSCEEFLEEQVFIEVASNNFFQDDADALEAVYGLYAKIRADGSVTDNNGQRESWGFYGMGEGSIFNLMEVPTDEIYVHWESYGGYWQYLEELSWLPNSGSHFDQLFADFYEGIGIANNLLANIESEGISQEVQDQVKGEALMARALFYSTAFSFYRNIPLVLEVVNDPHFKPFQAPTDSVIASVVRDLEQAAGLLPDPASLPAEQYGRFTRGTALALLARFQLNQGNWDAARDAARSVMELGYSLSPDYGDIFAVENSSNPEIIFCIPCIAQPGIGNTYIAHTAEPDYVNGGWGGHLLRNEFYATFDPEDGRREYLLNSYTTLTGGEGSVSQGYMIMKYEVDPDRVGPWAGNDLVLHRYAEVLLTLAEALNELQGPNQESIDLINLIRARAFEGDASKLFQLEDFASKEELRKHILDERGWELYGEGYRRDDLIRQGRFVEQAVDRGKTADEHQILFPIPQVERDRNTNLEQNPGYNQ